MTVGNPNGQYVQKWVTLPRVVVSPTGTAVRLTADDSIVTTAVKIQAELANTGIIFLGDSTVTSLNGVQLLKGSAIVQSADIYDEFPFLIRPFDMFIDASVINEGVRVSFLCRTTI